MTSGNVIKRASVEI